MRSPRQKTTAAAAGLLAMGFVVWFVWPAWLRTRPYAPFPLDDVYIHLDYARSFSLREPFAWLPDQGYSSGETAPLYAVVLAALARLGLSHAALGLAASAFGAVCVGYGVSRWARIAPGRWVGLIAPATALGFGVMAWSLCSGMELALYFALFATLCTTRRHTARWLALLVLVRPEALVLALLVGAGTARGVRDFGRRIAPALAVQALVFAANWLGTGELQSAGAILKLVTENPALDDPARMREVLTNLASTWFGAYSRSTVSPLGTGALLLALVGLGLAPRRDRGKAYALLAGAVYLTLLVSLNATARYQAFRYYVPALLCLFALVIRGAYVWPRFGALAGLGLVALCAPKLPVFRSHFERSAANIRDQQIEVGLRLAGSDARLLVGDAGAIPYFSGRPAIDALGLGGYRGLGFVRAATHGEAATLELLQHLPVAERPTHLALYATWFPELTRHFGRELFAVHLDDNVICGAPTKTVYRADWSHLGEHVPELLVPVGAPAHLIDTIDFADLESEQAHRYRASRFAPTGVEVRYEDEDRRFDGCRRIAPDEEVRVTLHALGDLHSTRVAVRGLNLQNAHFSIAPAADGTAKRGTFAVLGAPEWEIGTTFFAPARSVRTFELRVLAGAGGVSLCSAWWTED